MMPFGEVVYFFAEYLPDAKRGRKVTGQAAADLVRTLSQKKTTIKQLEYSYKNSPSLLNQVRLAQGLHDKGEYLRAADLFDEVLRKTPQDKDALYGLATCAIRLGDRDRAQAALEALVELDVSYLEFAACYDLARTYSAGGRTDAAIDLLQVVVKKSERLGPKKELADHLMQAGRKAEAVALLEEALQAYDASPGFVRNQDRKVALQARTMLKMENN